MDGKEKEIPGQEETVEEEVQTEEVETTEAETETEEPVDDTGEEEIADDEIVDDEDEELDWSDYLDRVGDVPDAWKKSPEEMIASAKESLQEMKRAQTKASKVDQLDALLKANGVPGGIEAVLNYQGPGGYVPPPQTQPMGQGAGQTPSFRSVLNQAIQQGRISPELANAYGELLPFFDIMFDTTYGGLDYVMNETQKQYKQFGAQSSDEIAWARFMAGNNKFNDGHRGKLQSVKNRHNFDSYEEAAMYLKMKDPGFFEEAFGRAVEKGKKKGFRLRGFGPKKKAGRGQSPGLGKYFNKDGTLNDARLLADVEAGVLSDAKADAIIKKSVTH